MEIPRYEPFYLDSLDQLRTEIDRLGLREIALSSGLSSLAQPLFFPRPSLRIPNRFCAQPLTGHDADPVTGAPGPLSLRRYHRYAQGGFGLIWVESTLAGPPAARWEDQSRRLRLHEGNQEAFRSFTESLREAAPEAILILQLDAPALSQPFPRADDDEIAQAQAALIQTAELALQAGFTGVDIQACRGSLACALLSARERPGRYGGSLANRSRFLRETLAALRARSPGLLLATRLCAYEATRHGFGVDSRGPRFLNPEEPCQLARLLSEDGCLDLLNVTAASPNLAGPASGRSQAPHADGEPVEEHPLTALDRQLHLARLLREAAPGLPVVGSGFGWLRHFLPEAAAGALATGRIDVAGLGRGALACPDAPAQIREHGRIQPGSACMVCFACVELHQDGRQPVGCVPRDGAVYGPAYRQSRRFAPDQLAAGARRCHGCEAAPCVAACPTGMDIPSLVAAYLRGDLAQAWDLIRSRDVLPEMTAQLSLGWLHREGACVETALTGRPVPVLDLQYAVSWDARQRGQTGLRLPAQSLSRRLAVVGGGPCGLAAAIRLLEHGFAVDLFERAPVLGGTPERVIPSSRFSGAGAEVEAVLAPALATGALRLHLGCSLGEQVRLEDLRSGWDAVLLAAGFWREQSLLPPGQSPPEGVIDALTFLETAKKGELAPLPRRVAILGGGDCAMDAARVARQGGARELFVVYGGPRASLHWHMPEEWFAKPGVHALMLCQPLAYEAGPDARLTGLRVRHTELELEGILAVELAVEALGLGMEEPLRATLAQAGVCLTGDGRVRHRSPDTFETHADRIYAAGALINGGDTVARCVAEGLQAAECLRRDLAPV